MEPNCPPSPNASIRRTETETSIFYKIYDLVREHWVQVLMAPNNNNIIANNTTPVIRRAQETQQNAASPMETELRPHILFNTRGWNQTVLNNEQCILDQMAEEEREGGDDDEDKESEAPSMNKRWLPPHAFTLFAAVLTSFWSRGSLSLNLVDKI
jgi:hypothetical protein